MADNIKILKYNPETHKFSDDLIRAKGNECYAIIKDNATKTSDVFENLKNMELVCPYGFNSMPTINNNPTIEVKPNINVYNGTSSLKRYALILAAGAATGIIALKYGPAIANYAATQVGQFLINHVYTIGSTVINSAVNAIGTLGSFVGSYLKSKPVDTKLATQDTASLKNDPASDSTMKTPIINIVNADTTQKTFAEATKTLRRVTLAPRHSAWKPKRVFSL